MPRPLTPCLTCGAPARGPRCPTHDRDRQPKRAQYLRIHQSPAWRRLSKATIQAQPWCTYCGSTDDLTADLVVPLELGGSIDETNVVTACRPCNSKRGAQLTNARRQREGGTDRS